MSQNATNKLFNKLNKLFNTSYYYCLILLFNIMTMCYWFDSDNSKILT